MSGFEGNGAHAALRSGLAILFIGSMLGTALAQTKPAAPPPDRGGQVAPGASTGVKDTPIIGSGSTGNGGIVEGQPGNSAPKNPKDATPDLKAPEPDLSK